jgi:hypothetical protein
VYCASHAQSLCTVCDTELHPPIAQGSTDVPHARDALTSSDGSTQHASASAKTAASAVASTATAATMVAAAENSKNASEERASKRQRTACDTITNGSVNIPTDRSIWVWYGAGLAITKRAGRTSIDSLKWITSATYDEHATRWT